MRIYLYNSPVFTVDHVLNKVKDSFTDEQRDLENKMKRVERWEKRLAQLKDPKMVSNVQALLKQFEALATKHNIAFVPSKDKWSHTIDAKYVKDNVTLDLWCDLNVTPEKLWANFYSRKHNSVALRIYIGKEVRVTDKILVCLLKG